MLLLVSCLLCCASPAAAQTTFPIGVQTAYLHIDPADLATDALAIDLGAMGLVPGYTIQLETAGDWNAGPGGDVQVGMLGVFSGDATLLGPTFAHRVPGAIDAGIDNFSGGTWPNNEPTEIPEDFTISRPGITIVIPPGAKFLFVTPADIYYRDNSDPDGDLGVTITLISTTSVSPNLAPFALSAQPNPFNHQSSIRFHLPAATSVRLAVHDVTGRLVRILIAGDLTAGDHQVQWDGRDGFGRPVPSGSYFARILEGSRSETVRLVRVR